MIVLRYNTSKGNAPTKPFGWYKTPSDYELKTTPNFIEFEGEKEETTNLPRLTEQEEQFKQKQPEDEEDITTWKSPAVILLAQKKKGEATESLVNYIKDKEIIKTTKNDDKPEMWVYREGIYIPEARSTIKWYCRALLGEVYTSALGKEVIDKIEADTYIEEKEFFNQQNKNPYLLPIKNGLLNIKTRELREFTPEIAFFNKVNANYDPDAECPNIEKFLSQILSNEEDKNVIQEMIGYCLLREYRYEKAFMLYGSHGRNGKSKLLELIKLFVGSDNISGVSLEDIEKDDFAISSLQNKLVNISGDISNEAIKNTGKFKSLTGRDTISANRKFKARLDFVNYAKVIFACNELPPVFTLSDAFWLRWVLVEFPYQFLPQKELNAQKSENARLQDQQIIDKISSEEELDGLLIFALKGLQRLFMNKDFSSSKTANELRKDWQRKSNSVAAFIEDHIKEDFTSYIVKSDFIKQYKIFCDKHRLKQMSERTISITLKESLGVSESRPTLDNGSRVNVWNGVSFINV